jgi:2,3-bisphosphoglycerate-independent phosphoglycerate mutase
MLVLDGLGDTDNDGQGTALQMARTHNMDQLAQKSALGLAHPVFPGITPGSGPGHIGLFGYDPVIYQIGRGVLSALGLDFKLEKEDVAARLNFCTLDYEGKVADRRAGRISSEKNHELLKK